MLNKMNSCCLDCLADCPNAPTDDIYICQLAWNGQFVFLSDLHKFIELEQMHFTAKGDKILTVEDIDKYLGLEFVPDCDKRKYFSITNLLEFEVISTKYNGKDIYKIHFLSSPDEGSTQNNTFKKDEILSGLSILKDEIRDNFMGSRAVYIVLDRIDVICGKVSDLEVK